MPNNKSKRLIRGLIVAAALSILGTYPAWAAPGRVEVSAGTPGLVVREDFVGFEPEVRSNGEEWVTWVGTAEGGAHFIWGSSNQIAVNGPLGRQVKPEYVGRLNPSQVAEIKSNLGIADGSKAVAAAAAAVPVCSILVASPYVDMAPNPDQVKGTVQQYCSGIINQRVTEALYRRASGIYLKVATADSGTKSINPVTAVGARNCVAADARYFKNQGVGYARGQNGVNYTTGTITGPPHQLGCVV